MVPLSSDPVPLMVRDPLLMAPVASTLPPTATSNPASPSVAPEATRRACAPAFAVSTGMLPTPDGMATTVVAVGTEAGFQLPASDQSVLLLPVHTWSSPLPLSSACEAYTYTLKLNADAPLRSNRHSSGSETS